jgi:hypothetical protein
MKKTGCSVAAALAFAVSAAAQTATSTTADMQSRMNDAAMHDLSVTGCLEKATDGGYILTNGRLDMAVTDQSRTSTTSPGTATGTTGSVPTNTAEAANAGLGSAMTWFLQGGTDLETHLGHRVQVMGKSSWSPTASPTVDRSRTNPTSTTATAGAAATTTSAAGSTTTGATTTAGGTAPTTTANSASTTAGKGVAQPRLDVQSVKTIAASCS